MPNGFPAPREVDRQLYDKTIEEIMQMVKEFPAPLEVDR